jgi:hypothetical protein
VSTVCAEQVEATEHIRDLHRAQGGTASNFQDLGGLLRLPPLPMESMRGRSARLLASLYWGADSEACTQLSGLTA